MTRPSTLLTRRSKLLHLTRSGPSIFENQSLELHCDDELPGDNGKARSSSWKQHRHSMATGAPCFRLSDTAPSPGKVLVDNLTETWQKIGYWYFVTNLPKELEICRSAQYHWIDGIWELALASPSMFSAVETLALHKRAALTGWHLEPAYLKQKGRVIQKVLTGMGRLCPESHSPTIAAIGVLAYLDILDGQYAAANTHLRALYTLVDVRELPPNVWLYCAWVDLRHALLTGQKPHLPNYVPTPLREASVTTGLSHHELSRLASLNASQCPRSPSFTLDMACDLFGKLHAVCSCSDWLPTTDRPPFGRVYDLEYDLRVFQAQAKRKVGDMFTLPITLITAAAQIHVWMASRFWTPQRRESHLTLLATVFDTVEAFGDMTTQWYVFAGLESLLWVLFTITASSQSHGLRQSKEALILFHKSLKLAHITRFDSLEERLRVWPWLENWHPNQLDIVWATLCWRFPDLVPRTSCQVSKEAHTCSMAGQRWFFGGLEFYAIP